MKKKKRDLVGDAKLIAFRVIKTFVGGAGGHFGLKYFTGEMVLNEIQTHTSDFSLQKEAYSQTRRALNNLGFDCHISNYDLAIRFNALEREEENIKKGSYRHG